MEKRELVAQAIAGDHWETAPEIDDENIPGIGMGKPVSRKMWREMADAVLADLDAAGFDIVQRELAKK